MMMLTVCGFLQAYVQIGGGRQQQQQQQQQPDSSDDDSSSSSAAEYDDDEEDDVDDFFTIVGVWERGGSRSRCTRTECIEVRFAGWERARRPDLLLPRCIERLLQRTLAGRPAPRRVGIGLQPPGWDNAFHVPLRAPQQNTAHAMAAAIEAFAKNYDALDIFSSDVRFKISAVWPLSNADDDARGACADTPEQARGTVHAQSLVPVLNGGVDRWCLARAIQHGLAFRQICVRGGRPVAEFRAHCMGNQGRVGGPPARQMLRAAGVCPNLDSYGVPEARAIQRWLDHRLGAQQVRLVILSREHGFRVVWKGAARARFNLCLVAQAGHYGYIQRPEQLFQADKWCVECETRVDRRSHPDGCRALCTQCFRFGWGQPCVRRPGERPVRCPVCDFVFPNAECFDAHRRRLDPAPPGWQHDRRRRPHRSMCEERRICHRCTRVVWTRFPAHRCVAQQQPLLSQRGGLCTRCGGPHDPSMTSHFIQPKQGVRQFGAALRQPIAAAAVSADEDDDDDDDSDEENVGADERAENKEEVEREERRKKLQFLFCDVECAQVAVEQPAEEEDNDPAAPPVLKHFPVLICAEVICERCIADGVCVEREPMRRAPDCHCGAPWQGQKRAQWAMPVGADAFEEGEEDNANNIRPAEAQMPPDGLNPRRLRFFRDAQSGRGPMQQFVDFLLTTGPMDTCTVMLAHNGGRYDVHLMLEELLARALRPRKLVSTGLRVYTLELGGRRQRTLILKDTLNFYGCALSKLPATFGLHGVADKPYFPYGYISEANMDVPRVGIPERAAYDPDRMRPAERAAFVRWYDAESARQRPFTLRQELLRYCANDVRILRAATLRFREVVAELAGGMEPFMASSTIAGLAMAIYRQCHLPPDVMVHTPEGGFLRGRRASVASRQFFALVERWRPEWAGRIRTAQWSIGEACVEDDGFRLDGVINRRPPLRPLAIEFNGCYYHGCLRCFPQRRQRLAGGQSAEQLLARTQQRAWLLEQRHGYEVCPVWECEFRDVLRRNRDMRRLYKAECRAVPAPLDLRRDALFGGRVEPFALHYKCKADEEIEYLDIVSLYPYVMKYREFPVGLPRVLTTEALHAGNEWGQAALPWTRAADNPYKGFLQCRVLPPTPRRLGPHHALLPYRTSGGRLTFPLCAACAEAGNADRRRRRAAHRPFPRCRHADERRAWTHAFTHVELNAALALGYRVVDLHEVWHYPQWASKEADNSLFGSYVDTLMRIKVEASGWPPGCDTPEQRAAYVRDYAEREGIHIDPARVQYNPGLRAVAKALLNSLWGKYAQRAERDEVIYTDSARAFHDLLATQSQDLVDFVHINEHIDRSVVRKKHPFVRAPPTNNLAVACFVTSHARVYLHERLEEVRRAGWRLLYADTDSAMSVKRRGEAPLASEGDALGQLKREMPGRRIVRFVCAGPKNYAFQHVCAQSGEDARAERKIRGLQLTHTASQMLPFDRLCRIVLNYFERRRNAEQRVAVPYSRFVRTKRADILTRQTTKLYQPVYTKGLVVAVPAATPDDTTTTFFTRPFGWYDDDDDDDDVAAEEEEENGDDDEEDDDDERD